MTPNTNPAVKVEQVDREAAASAILKRMIFAHGYQQPWMDAATMPMRMGEQDDHEEVQAFARDPSTLGGGGGEDDRFTPFKSHADCDTAAIYAVRLLEDAEDFHANCAECDGEGVPELCEARFPHFDAARVQRRLVMQSLAALTTPPAQTAGRWAIARTIYDAMQDDREDWAGNLLVLGCQEANYCDPEDAAWSTALLAADAILALTPAAPDVREMREALDNAATALEAADKARGIPSAAAAAVAARFALARGEKA